eukprot:5763608-Lingulodinium_polyedra.AAC.1
MSLKLEGGSYLDHLRNSEEEQPVPRMVALGHTDCIFADHTPDRFEFRDYCEREGPPTAHELSDDDRAKVDLSK